MAANNGIVMQMIINKKLRDLPRLGFFSVTSIITDWGERQLTDFMNQSLITYRLYRGLNVVGGYHYTTEIRATAGLQYILAEKDWLVILYPRVDLSTDSNFETFISAEYTPKINNTFSLYTRLQGLYTLRMNNGDHQRSYIWARVGLGYSDYTFGIGGNIDYFGPDKKRVINIGFFGSVDLY